MYTAKINRKQETERGLKIFVTFYRDGNESHTKDVIPQDERGFYHWLESELSSLNSGLKLNTDLVVGEEVVIPAVTDTRTQAEKDQENWFMQYYKLERLETLASKNFLTGARLAALTNKIAQAKTYLDANVKVEYLDLI